MDRHAVWARRALVLTCVGPIIMLVALGAGTDEDPTRYGWAILVAGLLMFAPLWIYAVGTVVDTAQRVLSRRRRTGHAA